MHAALYAYNTNKLPLYYSGNYSINKNKIKKKELLIAWASHRNV